MMLQMFIGDMLIDQAEINFRLCKTLVQREDEVTDVKSFLFRKNFEKAFISHVEPVFYLVAESLANNIIKDDLFENKLVSDLEFELKLLKKNNHAPVLC